MCISTFVGLLESAKGPLWLVAVTAGLKFLYDVLEKFIPVLQDKFKRDRLKVTIEKREKEISRLQEELADEIASHRNTHQDHTYTLGMLAVLESTIKIESGGLSLSELLTKLKSDAK